MDPDWCQGLNRNAMRHEDMGLTRFPQHGNMPRPSMLLPP